METTEYKPTYEQLEEALNITLNRADEMNGRECGPHFSANLREVIAEVLAPPPPTYKEVTVERWYCPVCEATYPEMGTNRCCGKDIELVQLTGTRRVPVKQPVRKSAVISFDNFGCYHVLSGDSTVNGTKGTYNWEE